MDRIELFNLVKQRVIVGILGDDELVDRLVLKGGNLLQYAYQLTSRASKDVDISVDGDFVDTEALANKVRRCLVATFDELGMAVVDFSFVEVPAFVSEDLKSFWGGYECKFKLMDRDKLEATGGDIERIRRLTHPLHDTGSPTFSIDFNRHEFCEDKEEFVVDGYTIFGYSPRMFVAEKLRAICQQMPDYSQIVHRNRPAASRARDFVDIQVIVEHYGIDFHDAEFHEILKKTFATKKVPISWLGRIAESRGQHEPDFQSVRASVRPGFRLQDFDFYFENVCDKCAQLKTLWDE